MRYFTVLKLLLLAALISGCAGRSLIADDLKANGKTVLIRVLKDEKNYSPEVMYILRQNFKASRVYRHASTAGRVEGSGFPVLATYNGYSRIPDSIHELERGDFVEISAPYEDDYDHDGGIFPVVIALHCKGADKECLAAKRAPKMYESRIGRQLRPDEYEELRNPRNFTPFYNEDKDLVRALPK